MKSIKGRRRLFTKARRRHFRPSWRRSNLRFITQSLRRNRVSKTPGKAIWTGPIGDLLKR